MSDSEISSQDVSRNELEVALEEIKETAQEHKEKAEAVERSEVEAEQYGWADALEWSAEKIRKEVIHGE